VKAILFSDIHLGLANDSEHFHEIVINFAKWMAEQARSRNIKTLICGGDIFHNRKAINLLTIDAAFKFFNILDEFDVRIITGNHDCFFLENSDVHSISLLKKWKNISVYDTPYYENFDGSIVGFIPWGTTVDSMQKCDIMFGHYEINGFQMGPKQFCEEGMTPANLLRKCPLIFSGHFHKPQINKYGTGDIIYMGSPFQHNWGEAGQEKYIYELDFETKEYEKIENTVSPKHVTVSTLDELNSAKGNIVRVVTDSAESDLMKQVSKVSTISLDSIILDKEIMKSAETIKDFKGVDPIEGSIEVANNIEGLTDELKKKVISKVKDIHSRVS
jgi:DNA repair exonuclease SbcCD nuclease subunit